MLHLSYRAKQTPDKPAIIMGADGYSVSFKELEERSNQAAHLFRSFGLKRGDHIAFIMENHPCFFEVVWAAQKAGLYFTPISYYLKPDEIAYIVDNCGAQVFISSIKQVEDAQQALEKSGVIDKCFLVGEKQGDSQARGKFSSWEEAIANFPMTIIDDMTEGREMLYSSGTTGHPKGIKFPLSEVTEPGEAPDIKSSVMLMQMLGIDENATAMTTSPLYHSLPFGTVMGSLRMGCTVVLMEKFDAERALHLIEKYKVDYSQWVPTMFVRLSKLPEDIKRKYDVSSMRMMIHGAAPCPIQVKEEMINWFGPVLWEFYSGSERNGIFMIGSDDWMSHKGSVGRCVDAEVHIVDDETGKELPVGEVGTIYCSKGEVFQYHGDEEKTQSITINDDWTTLGDVGYLDKEGFLYLTDRKSYMIISGGVNVYPQETEDCLIIHEKVADVAVFGVPNSDLGEEVKAVVQAVDFSEAGEALERELIEYCKSKISKIKCPKSIDFEEELPREDTGKLKKRLIKDRYWN
jgi:acyl-CoA synthetase (AMP-forming)/AMP-acid ligase II